MDLCKQKPQIRRKIMEGIKQIDKKIFELQKKMSVQVTKPEENKKHEMKKVMWTKRNQRFAPQKFQNLNFQKKFHLRHHHHKKPKGVKFRKTKFINIPKENNEYDFKIKTIDDFGKCLLNKTQEITNRLIIHLVNQKK